MFLLRNLAANLFKVQNLTFARRVISCNKKISLPPVRTFTKSGQLFQDIDYYCDLEVKPTATQAEIQHAYKRLSRLYDPTRYDNMTEAVRNMQRINEAFRVLGNAERRRKYDLGMGLFNRPPTESNQSSNEEFAKQRLAAYKRENTGGFYKFVDSHQTEHELGQKRHIIREEDDPDEQNVEFKKFQTTTGYILGAVVIIICMSFIYLFFENRSYEQDRKKYLEQKLQKNSEKK